MNKTYGVKQDRYWNRIDFSVVELFSSQQHRPQFSLEENRYTPVFIRYLGRGEGRDGASIVHLHSSSLVWFISNPL